MPDVSLQRSYTPVLESLSNHDTKSNKFLHFLIKTYPDGAVTKYLNQLEIGSSILVSDTQGSFDKNILKNVCHLVIVYAGTGFTPMVKVLKEFLSCVKNSPNTLTIISFNKSSEDIIWKNQIDALEKSVSELPNLSINIHHVLSQPITQTAGYHYGRISTDLLSNLLRPELQNNSNSSTSNVSSRLCCICGPIPFNREAKQIFDKQYGYKPEELHVFEG